MIRNILVADDERTNALLLAKRLEKEGYTVSIALNGREALDVIRYNPIDLLITDVVMPEMDGVDLYMALKDNPEHANLPVLIVTDKEMFQESFAALGAEIYCPKPFNFIDLLDKIKKIESQKIDGRRYHKAILIGPHADVLEQMSVELLKRDCIVAKVDNVIEIGLRCFTFNPEVIIIDIHSREYATTKEIVRSLRAYKCFSKTFIAIYSHFGSAEFAGMGGADSIELEIKMCLEAGANKYIGRFNRVTFLEQLKDCGF
ncbi:MAG: response regulator [Candidatus Omnitrophica bacterium]|nr:response regulator [Candidatus Omnitrophota bacterium]